MEGGEDDDSERAALPRQASVRVRLRFRGGVRAGAGKAQLLALESSSGGVCAPSLPGRLPRACNVHPRQINWTFNVGRRSGVGVDRGEEAAAPTLPVKQEGSRLPKRATFSAGEQRRLPLAASPPPPPLWFGLAWLGSQFTRSSCRKRSGLKASFPILSSVSSGHPSTPPSRGAFVRHGLGIETLRVS